MKICNVENVFILLSEIDKDRLVDMLREKEHEEVRAKLHLCIETDEKGFITSFMPSSGMTWGLIFFLQNLMISQRMFYLDKIIEKANVI